MLAQDVHHDGEKSRMYAWQKGTQTKEIFGERERDVSFWRERKREREEKFLCTGEPQMERRIASF